MYKTAYLVLIFYDKHFLNGVFIFLLNFLRIGKKHLVLKLKIRQKVPINMSPKTYFSVHHFFFISSK